MKTIKLKTVFLLVLILACDLHAYPGKVKGSDGILNNEGRRNSTINVFSTYGHRPVPNFCLPGGMICMVLIRHIAFEGSNSYNLSVSGYPGGGAPGTGLVHFSFTQPMAVAPEDSVIDLMTAARLGDDISIDLGYESIMLAPGSYRMDQNGEAITDAIINGSNFIQTDFCSRRFPNNDTVKIFLASFFPPYQIIDSSVAVTHVNGSKFSALSSFPNASQGVAYYLVIRHRNSIETWSSGPVFPSSEAFVYDFTSSAGQAYGNNMEFINGGYCIFTGDVNQDGSVDLSDINGIYNDAIIFNSGYLKTDLNGDSIVDLFDLSIAYNGSVDFISVIRP